MVKLGKLGEVEFIQPRSLAIGFEIVTLWAGHKDQATLSRICAAAIGVCVDHEGKLPAYNPNREKIIDYGFRILDRLLEAGVNGVQIFEQGTVCLTLLAQNLPSEEDVNQAVNFTTAKEEE